MNKYIEKFKVWSLLYRQEIILFIAGVIVGVIMLTPEYGFGMLAMGLIAILIGAIVVIFT